MATIIGITGSFGTGKTFVASVFGSLGASVIDADRIAHAVIQKKSREYIRIVKLFGKDILNRKGEIDRKRLGDKVFTHPALLKKLNKIVHPRIIKEIKCSIRRAKKSNRKGVVVIDAPLLIEAGLDRLTDKLVVVKCSKRRQVERCREKFCIQKKEIARRISSQMTLKKKLKMADLVIDNSGTKFRTREQVRRVWGEGKLWR
ncbi:MAG: dephospho-CoA kinase [Candidatus Omnitrophica bacterium]|nr:dephospho-CoA kinase [Candidatus Omnitrophota bacterium]